MAGAIHSATACCEDQGETVTRENLSVLRVDNLAIAVAQLSAATGHFIHVNPAFEKLTGYSALELLRKTPADITFEADRGVEVAAIAALLRGERDDFESVKRYVRSDGRIVWVRVRAVLVRDSQGRPVRTVAVIEDIDDRKLAEERLQLSERLYRATFEQAPVGIAHLSLEGRWLRFNEAVCQITGYSRRALEQMTFLDITHPDDVGRDWRLAQQLKAGEIDYYEMEKRYVRAAGDVVWVNLTAGLLRDEQQRPTQYISIIEDISSRKERDALQNRVRLQQRELQSVADHAPAILNRFDAGLRHIFVNRAIEAVTGCPPAEIVGKTLAELDVSESFRNLWESALRAVFQTGEPQQFEFTFDTPHGTGHFLTRLVGEQHDSRSIESVIGATIDVTERVRLEQALRTSNRDKDVFLATLAHELRNPLAVLRTSLTMLLAQAGLDEQTRALHAMMNRQATQLVRLVDDLMDLSQSAAGKLSLKRERVRVQELIERAIEAAGAALSKGEQTVTVAPEMAPLWLEVDPARLVQVQSNLLDNAAKYSGPGGQITIRSARESNSAIITVQDTGIGMSVEQINRAFDLFAQVSTDGRPRSGLGLGLSLVRRLVEMHGGVVRVTSAGLGRGCEFTVALPLAVVGRDEADAAAAQRRSSSCSS